MKLIRFGPPRREKPGLQLGDGTRVDVVSQAEPETDRARYEALDAILAKPQLRAAL